MNKIPCEKIVLDLKTSKPEDDVLNYYKSKGFDGVNDEGEFFFILLKSCIFIDPPQSLYKVSHPDDEKGWNSFGVYHRRFTEQLCYSSDLRFWPFLEWGSLEERLYDAGNISEDEALSNFNLIRKNTYCRGRGDSYYLYYDRYSQEQFLNVFRLLGNELIVKFIALLSTNRDVQLLSGNNHEKTYDFATGFPDLMLWNENRLIYREVKTINDQVRKNQRSFYETFFKELELDFKITNILYE